VASFHHSKKSASVLKHAIIDQYATPFASKTGKGSLNHRVAFIDGYAGPGRYDDGAEGSGAMLLRKAHELASLPRTVELHFVEEDQDLVAKLNKVIETEGQGVQPPPTVTDGDISTHLPALLEATAGIPLFVYLDPCGLIMPMDEVAKIFSRPRGLGTPATEVLINLTAGLRRFGGMLTKPNPVEASLKRIDAVCDGTWWRKTWLDNMPDKAAAELAVVSGYAERLSKRAGGAGTWIIDVKPRADLKPVYYLVFATRHIDGMLYFGESASLGLERWRKFHAEQAAKGTLFAEGWETQWKAQEANLKSEWVTTLADRLVIELAKGQSFKIMDRPQEILGDELVGLVRDMHFRSSINKVRIAGKTSTDPTGLKNLLTLQLTPM
jgi:three-Cys-motif partner protein